MKPLQTVILIIFISINALYADMHQYCFEVQYEIEGKSYHGYYKGPYDNIPNDYFEKFSPNDSLFMIEFLSGFDGKDSVTMYDNVLDYEIKGLSEIRYFILEMEFKMIRLKDVTHIHLVSVRSKDCCSGIANVYSEDLKWINSPAKRLLGSYEDEVCSTTAYDHGDYAKGKELFEELKAAYLDNNLKKAVEILEELRKHKIVVITDCS